MKPTSAFLLAASISVLVPSALPAFAEDRPRAEAPIVEATAADAKAAIAKFESAFATQFTADKLRAIRVLAKVQSTAVASKLIEILKDKDENVRACACDGLALQQSSAAKAGAVLSRIAFESDDKPAVVAAAVTALGPLGYKKVAKDVERFIWNEEDVIVCAACSCFGSWKDPSALRTMYEFFDMYPDEKSFGGGSTSVDTGAEGGADQAAAKAKWSAKYGGQRNWRPRPEANKALRESLQAITGFAFRRPEDLALYMVEPKKYPDPEKITDRMDEPKRRAVNDAYVAAVAKAMAIAKKEFPGDVSSDERGKLYSREFKAMRADLIEKYKLRLSELDVIVAEGKSKGWTK